MDYFYDVKIQMSYIDIMQKVYGKAEVGAPPMSVPHLDTRFVNGEKIITIWTFAGFSPKFLKTVHI